MKFLRIGEPGAESPAVLIDGACRLLHSEFDDFFTQSFERNGGWDWLQAQMRRPEFVASLAEVRVNDVRVGAPVPRPSKVVCVGLNYEDHAREAGLELPQEPILFFKAPDTLIGPTDTIELPRGADKVDWEAEIAVIVAKPAYRIEPDGVPSVVAGYALSNDVSERRAQLERGGQWVKGKSFPTFNPLGPWLVPADQFAIPPNIEFSLHVNGHKRQAGKTSQMIFPIQDLISYISMFMRLLPGDVINTGTPAGVAFASADGAYLRHGDVVRVSSQPLGSHLSPVADPDS